MTPTPTLTQPGGVTAGVHRGGTDDEFIWDGVTRYDPPDNGLIATYGVNNGDEQLYGGDGNDVLVGGGGHDYLDGGPGNDYLFGAILRVRDFSQSPGNEHLPPVVGGYDGGYINILMGGPGNDYLYGDGEFDILNGGPGNDHLVTSGYGAAMIGGPGRDVFDVTEGRQVKIMDFQDGADKILLYNGNPGDAGKPSVYFHLHQAAARAGVQFDRGWIATEVDDGVTLQLAESDNYELTIEGAYLPNLQFELVNGDLFIV